MKIETQYSVNDVLVAVMDSCRNGTEHSDLEEQRQEDQFWIEQERLADEEKARRAREKLVLRRRKEIEQQRAAAGLCMFCGQRLGALLRWLGIKKHKRCQNFLE